MILWKNEGNKLYAWGFFIIIINLMKIKNLKTMPGFQLPKMDHWNMVTDEWLT